MQPATIEEKASRLLAYLRDHEDRKAQPPTCRDICGDLHISTETLAKCLNGLEAKGAIRRNRGRAKQIWVTHPRTEEG